MKMLDHFLKILKENGEKIVGSTFPYALMFKL